TSSFLSPKLNDTFRTTSSPSPLPLKNPSPAIVDIHARPPRTKTSKLDPRASTKPCKPTPRSKKVVLPSLPFPRHSWQTRRLPKTTSRKLGKHTPLTSLYKATSDRTTLPTPLHLSKKTLARKKPAFQNHIQTPPPPPPWITKKKKSFPLACSPPRLLCTKCSATTCHVSRLRLRCLTSRQNFRRPMRSPYIQ
ncbi:hypothetical protein GQ607_010189, partial [Colletotrichum asianum]